jgi:hypothetical protein
MAQLCCIAAAPVLAQVLDDEVELAKHAFGLVGQCLRRLAGPQASLLLCIGYRVLVGEVELPPIHPDQ